MINPFYIAETEKTFDRCLQDLHTSAKDNGFNVVHIHDMRNTFEKNNLEYAKQYSIVELCNPSKAHKALSADPRMGNMMPKEVIVYEDTDQKTKMMFMRPDPQMMDGLFPEMNISELSKNVSDAMQIIVDQTV